MESLIQLDYYLDYAPNIVEVCVVDEETLRKIKKAKVKNVNVFLS